jgi:hypothetical protein
LHSHASFSSGGRLADSVNTMAEKPSHLHGSGQTPIENMVVTD